MQARAERILYGVSCFVVSIKIVIISIQIAKVLTFFVTLHRFSRKLKHFMKILKWGFIGCGEVTEKKSGPAFNEVEGSSIVAVMSRNELKARTYAINHGVPKWYTDAQQLVDDPDVNAIYVATPPSSHATFAIMAMKAGKPVYVEKPLAASYEDCARINSISERTGVPCFVAYYRRYLPYFLKVKKMVEDGMIGHVLNVQVRFAVPPRELDYSPTLPEEATSTTLPPTSWTCCRPCLALFSTPTASAPIGRACIRQKTPCRPASASKTVSREVACGASWPTSRLVKTV